MKRMIGVIAILSISISQVGHGYRRFTYVHCNFALSGQDARTLLDDLVYYNVTCNKKLVTYTVHQTESRRDFIYLSCLDKWRIARVLRFYEPTTPLTSAIIQDILVSLRGKRKIIIQHVLQDFLKNPDSTIESVLCALLK